LEPLGNLSESARRTLAEIGPVWGSDIARHRDLVLQAYRPLLAAAPKTGVTVTRDIAYGIHPRQVLDVYRHRYAAGVPVVLFVHGGAFVRGDKDIDGEVYANVLYYFARHGYLGVNMEYRRAPEFKYPSGAEDVAAAVAWVREHAAEYGGDPERIFLVGHSAGGTHVGSYAYDPGAIDPRAIDPGAIDPGAVGPGAVGPSAVGPGAIWSAPAVSGLVLLSSRLRVDALAGNPNAEAVRAYFGVDESKYEQLSPLVHGAHSSLPVFIAIAEYENPYLDVYGAELFYRIATARGRAPRFLRLPRHNHISLVAHLNSEEDILGSEIRDFLTTLR
jgi:acetyl esterase